MSWILRTSVIVCSLLLASAALAAPPKGERNDAAARRHFESGREYYERAEYDAAAREFEEAYKLSGRDALLINLSKAHEAAGRLEDALRAMDLWFEHASSDDPLIGEMETRRKRLRADMERKAAEAAKADEPAPAPVEPVVEAPAPVSAAPATAPQQSNLWPWMTIGAGAALTGAGAVFIVLGRKDIDAVENPGPDTTWADVKEQHDRGPTRVGIGIALAAVGVAAAGAGFTWLLLKRNTHEANLKVNLGVNQISLRGAF